MSTDIRSVIPEVLEAFLAADHNKLESAYEINCGYCDLFAEQVEARCPTVEVIDRGIDDPNGGHIYLYDHGTGLYHDAECAEGVRAEADLPFFVRRAQAEATDDQSDGAAP